MGLFNRLRSAYYKNKNKDVKAFSFTKEQFNAYINDKKKGAALDKKIHKMIAQLVGADWAFGTIVITTLASMMREYSKRLEHECKGEFSFDKLWDWVMEREGCKEMMFNKEMMIDDRECYIG